MTTAYWHIRPRSLWLLLLLSLFLATTLRAQDKLNSHTFPEEVGEITDFDSSMDNPHFTLCDAKRVFQYYNTGAYYKDHKKEIAQFITSRYKQPVHTAGQTGYITIRFIINCKGETDRFRIHQMDSSYQERPLLFSGSISGQLLQLVKQIPGWTPAVYKDKTYDSYQYITFRIRNGSIISITP